LTLLWVFGSAREKRGEKNIERGVQEMKVQQAENVFKNRDALSSLPEKRRLVVLRKMALKSWIDNVIVPILVKEYLGPVQTEKRNAQRLSEIKPTPIPGFIGYGATEDGQIWSSKRAGLWTKREAVKGRSGYLYLTLRSDTGRLLSRTVASLVALAFIGPRPTAENGEPLEINHRDMNKENNAARNLEYVTREENIRHAQEMLRARKKARRERSEIEKLAKEQGVKILA
jgi:hypothetical protein